MEREYEHVTGADPLKVAVTVLFVLVVTVHVLPLTLSQPDQPPNVDPCSAVAVSVTGVLGAYVVVPVFPLQLITLGQLISPVPADTLPLPVPASIIVRLKL